MAARRPQRQELLKSLRAESGIVPALAGERVPEPINDLVTYIEEAGALGPLQPLVSAGKVRVTTEILDVQMHHAKDLGAVYSGKNAFVASQRTQLRCRQRPFRL